MTLPVSVSIVHSELLNSKRNICNKVVLYAKVKVLVDVRVQDVKKTRENVCRKNAAFANIFILFCFFFYFYDGFPNIYTMIACE